MTTLFRFAEQRDTPALRAVYAPFCETTGVSFETEAPSVEEMARRVARVSERLPWLVCETEGRLAGFAYASPHRDRAAYRWSVDVAVYIDEAYRRLGVGRGLYTSLFRVLALLGYYKALAGVALPNPASVGLHRAVGFEPVGIYRGVGFKLGAWRDVAWWQLGLRPEGGPPAEPSGVNEVIDSPAVRDALREGLALVRRGVAGGP